MPFAKLSSIKRKLINTRIDYITTYQTFNRGCIYLDYHYFYAYLQPQFSEYDAWFNVKDDYLIFGVSVKDTSKIGHYYSKFIEYMKLMHNARIEIKLKEEKWVMPHIMPGCPVNYGKGRILFAGETAGFLNPMGEGISAGLESGNTAARAIQKVVPARAKNKMDYINKITEAGFVVEEFVDMDISNTIVHSATLYVRKEKV